MSKKTPILLLLFLSFCANAQNDSILKPSLDSLRTVWEDETKGDEVRLNALSKLIWDRYTFYKPDSAIYYTKIQYDFAKKINSKSDMSYALTLRGVSLWVKGNHKDALDNYNQSLVLEKELGDKPRIAGLYNKIGLVYNNLGDKIRAIDNYKKSYSIREKLSNKAEIGYTLNNIGTIYRELGDFERAIEYYQKSLEAHTEENNDLDAGFVMSNIGFAYYEQGKFDKALEYCLKSQKIGEELGDKITLADVYYLMGNIYSSTNENLKAINFYKKSEIYYEELDNMAQMALLLNDVGIFYHNKKDYKKSIDFCNRSYNVASKLSSIEYKEKACNCLYLNYKALGNKIKAFTYLEELSILNDSLKKGEIANKLQQMEFAKTMRLDSIVKAKEARITEEKLKTQESKILLLDTKNRTKSLWIIFGSLAAILLMGLLYYRYKQRVKYKDLQNELLNSEIEYKKKDLTNFAVNISNNQDWALSLAEKMESLKTSTGRKRAKELEELDTEIKNKIWVDKSADDFYTKIDSLSSSFYDKLTTQFKDLTKTEIRLCSLIKLDLDTKQIAALQNINPSSVKMSRNRLRKKLNLSPEDDLNAFLRTF